MATADLVIFWLNLAGAAAAVPVNFLAGRRGFLATAWVHYVLAAIALVYAVGYVMVLTNTLAPAQWSAFFRGVSVPVWWIVWTMPAAQSLLMWRRISTEVVDAASRLPDASADRR